jgi:hypothetical protein
MKTTHSFYKLMFLLTIICLTIGCRNKSAKQITTTADEAISSTFQIVSFSLPPKTNGDSHFLKDKEGNEFPIQIDAKGKAWAVVKPLKDNGKQFYLMSGKPEGRAEGIKFQEEDHALSFSINGRPIFTYQKQGALPNPSIDSVFLRGGYIHPVYTPDERIITDDYAANHLHHHGIWGAWTKTEFENRTPDFWNMGDKTGKVDFVSLDSVYEGAVMAGFTATHEYVDLSASEPIRVLNEKWEVKLFNIQNSSHPCYIFDIYIRQDCASSSPLLLPTYRYGGIGFRGREEWNGEENTIFLTSEGKDRTNGHGTTARWCHVGGLVNGDLAGITIMGHPDNFRAPQPMRIHPSEPFFNFAPSQAGDWAINPDAPYEAKYRFVVYDGEPNTELLEKLWTDYATPMEIEIMEKK